MNATLEAPVAEAPLAVEVLHFDMWGYTPEEEAKLQAEAVKKGDAAKLKAEKAEKAKLKAAAAPTPAKPKVARAKTFDDQTIGLFADDAVAALKVLELTEHAQVDVDEALERNPGILGVEELSPAEQQVARETLEQARFMRQSGLPTELVEKSLYAAGVDAPAVLEQLAQVEQVVGAEYPEQPLAELVDVEVDESEVDLEYDEGDDEAEMMGESASDDEPKAKRKKKGEAEAVSDTALTALMRRIRGPRYSPLTQEQENVMAARIRAGDPAARNELVEHNMRFLVAQAKKFTYTGRPMDFLISAGTKGLITAAEKFDPARGRFTTCAAQWIRQSIQRELLGDSLLKTPAYLPVKANKLRREAEAATDPVQKAELQEKADAADREVKARRAMHVSLDGGQDDDSDGGGLHNMFASEAEGPDEMMEKRQLITQLVKAAHAITDAEGELNVRGRDIFLLRMGLHEEHIGEPQTLAEVATRYEISRERVRQLYTVAAIDIANAVQVWARGEDNLPANFRKSLLNPGR